MGRFYVFCCLSLLSTSPAVSEQRCKVAVNSEEAIDISLLQLKTKLSSVETSVHVGTNSTQVTSVTNSSDHEASVKTRLLKDLIHLAHKGPRRHFVPTSSSSSFEKDRVEHGSLEGLCAAIFITFMINLVDVLWMMPFICSKDGVGNSVFYIATSFILVLISIVLVESLNWIQHLFSTVHLARTVDLITAVLLGAYAAYLYTTDATGKEACHSTEIAFESADVPTDALHEATASSMTTKLASPTARFVVVVCLGSLDQILVYVPLLQMQEITGFELLLGAGVSASVCVGLCFLLNNTGPLANVLRSMPLWVIVSLLALWSLVGFIFE